MNERTLPFWIRLAIGLCLILLTAYIMANILGCGTQVHNEYPSVTECHMRECPSDEQILEVLSIVKKDVPGLELDKELDIIWDPQDYVIEDYEDNSGFTCPAGHHCYIEGLTTSPTTTEVTSIPVLIHEVIHVYFWRTTGDGDANHATPPGPWTSATDTLVARLSAEVFAEHPDLIKYY